MYVKWHGVKSSVRDLPGGGPQGSTFGILEYLSQSNENAMCVDKNYRYKWVDDLTILEVVNLLSIGISSYDVKNHVPNDIAIHNQFLNPDSLQSQNHLNYISNWTEEQQMKLNKVKSNVMTFNFTHDHKFSTRLTLEGDNLQTISKTKLLGTVISDDLKWDDNTKLLVKRANSRMQVLNIISGFNPPIGDMKQIYIAYIRSILEQSSVVWNSSLKQENVEDLERVQKNAFRLILKENYKSYNHALEYLNLQSLQERRNTLSLKFALKNVKNKYIMDYFKENKKKHEIKTVTNI